MGMAVPQNLTAAAKAGGCASKLSPGVLDSVLKKLPPSADPNLLVGFSTSDDAGVYRITEDLALVQTVDFFTPIVDDPFTYGQIAAANALSDVYAMGGKPVSALSIVAFPASGEPEILEQVLRGGLSKMDEARCVVVGGHSVRDEELKFGYAVTGLIDPRRIWRNVGAKPGDVLLFTKLLGTGVIATALKQGHADAEGAKASAASMTRLNSDACAALRKVESHIEGRATPIHAVTDVTGFSLLGHAREMAMGSGVSFEIDHAKLKFLPGARGAASAGYLPGGMKNIREWLAGCVEIDAGIPEDIQHLLFDPQTSGGLLIAIAPESAMAAREALTGNNVEALTIGRVLNHISPLLRII
jgi:selenide,water dikinase